MNKPNLNFYPNGVHNNYNPKLFLHDNHNTPSNDHPSSTYATNSSSYFYPTPPIYGNHLQFASHPQSDSSICDGMSNCHLADSWVNYMNRNATLPITQITNHIPILNSYIPNALKLQPFANYLNHPHHPSNYAEYHKNYLESIYERQETMTAENSAHPQQQLLRDGFSRRIELNYEAPPNDHHQNKSEPNETIYDNISTSQRRQSKDNNELSDNEWISDRYNSKMCIKFQDRNKKIDFKKNFRDENRKINGCFYDSENDLSPRTRRENLVAPPPKKKWIKNYMNGCAGIKLCSLCKKFRMGLRAFKSSNESF